MIEELFTTPGEVLTAHRAGQREGLMLGILASAAAYYLFKAYGIRLPFKTIEE